MIRAMPFDWSEYLGLANELAKRTDEASLRSALSRAYYYVYHLALKRAQDNDFKALAGEGTHSQLWRVFGTNPDPDCRKLAAIGVRLKEKRERADYSSVYPRVQEEIPEVLSDARDFATRLGNLHSRLPNPRSQRQ